MRRFVKLALLVGLQVLASVVALETMARIFADVTNRVRGSGYHAVFGWKALPDVEKSDVGWGSSFPATTNSQGWRDKERSYQPRPGTRRIVALGDSYTFGWGVDDGQRFTDEMARIAPGLEVVNLGMHGYGTDQELLVFQEEGRRYSPGIVILATFVGNDLEDLRYMNRYGWPKPYFRPASDRYLVVPPRLTSDVRLRSLSYFAEFSFQLVERGRPSSLEAPVWKGRDTVPLFGWLVRQLSEQVKKNGGRLAVVLIYPPQEIQAGRSGTTRRLISAVNDAGVPVIDTFDAFRRRLRGGAELYVRNDDHWNSAGHRLAAGVILRGLRDRHWIDGGRRPAARGRAQSPPPRSFR